MRGKALTDMARRLLDLACVLVAAVPVLLVLVPIIFKIRRTLGKPALFRQERVGRDGARFTLYKLRSMTTATDDNGDLLPDALRLTPFGSALRSSSLDELPSLWNVLRGDMSIVGPRPLLVEYLPLYTPAQARRHEVRPGITGWAQVNGRNGVSWADKFLMDVWYVDHRSVGLDLKIIALTVRTVLNRQGISSSDHATMERFTGSTGAGSND